MSIFTRIQQFFVGDQPWAGRIRFLIFFLIPVGGLSFHIYNSIKSGAPFAMDKIILLYLLSFIWALASAVYYIRDIYQTDTDTPPFRYFLASFFGIFVPRVKIKNGTIESERDMVEKIGGPAYLDIDAGSAVLTETLTGPANVFGHGKKYFMPNHERIAEIVDLRQQEGAIPDLTVTARDGIQVKVENVKFNYRIWDNRWENLYKGKTVPRNPYPYSKQAIHNYAYNRAVKLNKADQPELTPWLDAVRGSIIGIISGYISDHRLDDVIAPKEQDEKKHPRQIIHGKAFLSDFKSGLQKIGTILNWWDPGEFKCEDPDVQQRFVTNWSVDIMSTIEINKAHGDAQKQAYEELGRAEAEAELLTSIIHALDGVHLGKNKAQTLQNLILMRTAQVIRALNTPPAVDQLSKSPEKPSSDNEHKTK
ncbi:MAG: hypothetical protein ABI904_00385 [Chloroflexota bacterium]